MPILTIYEDSRAPGTCRSCGAPIEWAELVSGKRHPFDAPIRPLRTQPSMAGTRVTQDVDTAVSSTHFATCPQGPAWRRPATGKA